MSKDHLVISERWYQTTDGRYLMVRLDPAGRVMQFDLCDECPFFTVKAAFPTDVYFASDDLGA